MYNKLPQAEKIIMKINKKILTFITLFAFTLAVFGGIVPIRAVAAPQTGADIIYAYDMQTAGGSDRRTVNSDGSISWSNSDQAVIWGIHIGDQLASMNAAPGTYYVKFLYKNKAYTQNQVQGAWGNSSNGDPLGDCLDAEKLIKYDFNNFKTEVINRGTSGQWKTAIIPITVTSTTDLNEEQTLRATVVGENGLITTGQYLYFSNNDTQLDMVYEDDIVSDPSVTPDTGGTGGLEWPKNKLYPNFPAPAATIDAVYVDKDGITSLSSHETLVARVAQGLINKTQPRVALLGKIEGDGNDHNNTIIERFYGYNLNRVQNNTSRDRLMWLIEKYKDEFTGYVKYNSTVRSGRNQNITASMAATEASLLGAIPATADMEAKLQEFGLTRVGTDFSNTTNFPVNDYSIYNNPGNSSQRTETRAGYFRAANWIYNNLREPSGTPGTAGYRPGYSKRLFASNPWTAQCIDLAAAVGAPIVWLEYGITTSGANHRELLNKYYQDMNDTFPMTDEQIGPAAIGFWNGEGTGVKGMSMYGITEMPSDNFRNWTLYAGGGGAVDPPAVPAKPTYDPTKRYVNLVVSDGDNASMLGGASLKWDFWPHESRTNNGRNGGNITSPVTYTFPPALMDAAPELVNLYYSQATVNDTFTGGPTGLGYIQPGVAANEWGGDGDQGQTGNNFFGTKSAAGANFPQYYAQWSNRYFEREGLNSLTVWHNLSGDDTWSNRKTFMSQQFFPTLLGLYSNKNDIGPDGKIDGSLIWEGDKPHKAFGAKNDYYGTSADLTHDYEGYYYPVKNAIEAITDTPLPANGKADFVSYQIIAWSGGRDATAEGGSPFGTRMENLRHFAQDYWGNNRVFLRQDHFFMLMTEAAGKPINNALRATTATSSNANDRQKLTDGSGGITHMWTSANTTDQWVTIDFNRRVNLSRYVMKNAELAGFNQSLNTKSYTIQASKNNIDWVDIGSRTGNTEAVDYGTFNVPATGVANRYRYVRFNITDAGADGVARIGEIEIYGINNNDVVLDDLEAAFERYDALDSRDYTLTSFAGVNQRYATAMGLYNSASGSITQKNVDDVTKALNAAIDALAIALKGDSNVDDVVEIEDARLALLHVVGKTTLSAQGFANADMNYNDALDAADVLALVKKIVLE